MSDSSTTDTNGQPQVPPSEDTSSVQTAPISPPVAETPIPQPLSDQTVAIPPTSPPDLNNNPPATSPSPTDQTSSPPTTVQKRKMSFPSFSFPLHNKMFLPVITLGILVFFGAGATAAYLFVITPKVNTFKFVNDFKPKISTLKTAFVAVNSSLEQLHQLAVEEIQLDTSNPTLKTQQPNSTSTALLIYAQNLEQFHEMLIQENPRIAGTEDTSETVFVQKLRALKNQAVVTDTNISSAQEEITKLITLTTGPAVNIPNATKTKLASSAQIQVASTPYFTQVQKITKYYQTLSDTLITMSMKIDSFKVSLVSALAPFSDFNSQSGNLNSLKADITQAEVFLQQAQNDTTEISNLAEALKKMPPESLPVGSQTFNEHNIKVFSSVADYFTSETNVLKGYLTALNSLVTKSQTAEVTQGDLRSFQIVVIEGALVAQKADAKFISDLQSLLVEEKTLAESFWQNNQTLATGKQVEKEIDDYDKKLAILIEQNKVPFLQ